MPFSSDEGKSQIMTYLQENAGKGSRVLDVGPGAGAYGKLLKSAGYTHVDAIEIFERYVTDYDLTSIYERVIVGDVCDVRGLRYYDVIILGDVLEHIPAVRAQALLIRLSTICRLLIVSIPWRYPQGPSYGNDHERHLQDDLTPEIMALRYPRLRLLHKGDIIGVYTTPSSPFTWPSISVCILTHARFFLLQEAVWSAMRLQYPGAVEIIILNDCPEQFIQCPDPRIKIINTPKIFTSVGAKRNAILRIASSEWVAWLDDDDYILPNHLLKIEQVAGTSAKLITSEQTLFYCEDRGEVASGACADTIIHRMSAIAVGCPDVSAQEDWKLVAGLMEVFPWKRECQHNPSYIQRWCNGAFHISGQGIDTQAHTKFRRDALHRISTGLEPTGNLVLSPTAPLVDYEKTTIPIITAWKALYGFK